MLTTPPPDPYKQLKASLTRLVNEHPPASIPPTGGLYKGPVSVAYTFLILQQMYNDLEIEGQLLGTWSAAYLKQAQDTIGDYPGPKPGKCGITDDILALLAIGAATSKDVDMVGNLCDYSAEVLDVETDNEFLYGRAGYLYLLRLVKASFIDDPKTLQLITDTQDDVVDAILDTPRPWKWHGKTYVGAIHGAIGIITQVVMTDPKSTPRKSKPILPYCSHINTRLATGPAAFHRRKIAWCRSVTARQVWSTVSSASGNTSQIWKKSSTGQSRKAVNASKSVVSSPKSPVYATVCLLVS